MVPTQMNQAGRSMIRTTHRGSLHHHFPEVLTMRFLLQIYMEENAMTEAEREQCYVDSTRLAQELDAKGQLLSVNPLQPISTAATVRVREGKRVVTDGPFAETREHLGGYFLVEAKDREEAISIAERIPGARKGTVEVRPVLDIPNLPVS